MILIYYKFHNISTNKKVMVQRREDNKMDTFDLDLKVQGHSDLIMVRNTPSLDGP